MVDHTKSLGRTYVITPRGEVSNRQSWGRLLSGVWHDFMRTWHLIRLDLKQQSFGLSLGNFWLLLEPALQAGAYYFLLTVVFAMRGSDATFAFFFIAITLWRSHSTLTTTAPYFLSIKGHNYIEQGFGLKIAFLEFAAQEILLFGVRMIVLTAFLIIAGYTPSITWAFFIFVAMCMFSFSLALSVWLAILGVLFKDVGKLVGHFVWLWWYLSPGLYSIKRIPDWAEPIFLLNPFSYIIPAAHSSLLDHVVTLDHAVSNGVLCIVSLAFMWLGWRLLRRFGYILAQYV
ncbi:ABC transporter permease [Hoeflea sp.]|uniref:ABC transporter permease n=1 Tax=Hoeflea sp. TaxID=1940281 RepID=UPI003749B531